MLCIKKDITVYMQVSREFGSLLAERSPFAENIKSWHTEQATYNLEERLDILVYQYDKLIRAGKFSQAKKVEAWIDLIQDKFSQQFHTNIA